MERRNFLGIAGLLGLTPIMIKNIFTEEQEALDKPIIGVGTPFTPEKFKANFIDDQPINLQKNKFEIIVTGQIIIKSKKNKTKIMGTGLINEENDTYKTINWEINSLSMIIPPIIKINKEKAKLINIYQTSSNNDTFDIENADQSYHSIRAIKSILICEKI